ncbi:hypothetical protein NQ315_008660 [Exocentrus adspersus]|uniref:Uncharacterized protein n=1 Tax=Exocentrus adspersus TaxID=1586481 RepID=A0AAV8W5X2_9CUCU|nr:hypothetical protein NQ315_008660 [Exocentrus adspersus]
MLALKNRVVNRVQAIKFMVVSSPRVGSSLTFDPRSPHIDFKLARRSRKSRFDRPMAVNKIQPATNRREQQRE